MLFSRALLYGSTAADVVYSKVMQESMSERMRWGEEGITNKPESSAALVLGTELLILRLVSLIGLSVERSRAPSIC